MTSLVAACWRHARVTLLCLIAATGACGGGGGATTPTAPAVANPMVTIQATYTCSPACTNDPDNYALRVGCASGPCVVFAESPLVNPNTLTWTGRLAPGRRTVEIRIARAASVNLSFRSNDVGTNTGGVTPGSITILQGDTGTVATRIVSRCDVTKVAAVSTLFNEWFYGFDVQLGSAATVC